MKNKFNYLLKTLFIFISLLFLGCETQEEVVSSSKRDIKKTRITLKELSSKPNAVSKIQEFRTKKSNLDSGKLVYNEEYDFFIDDQNMLLIEEGSKHWITIPIYRKKPNSNLENIILKPDENGLYKSFLASYQLTDSDRENLKNGIPIDDLDIKTTLYAVEGKYVGQLYDLGNGECGYVNHVNEISSSTIEVTFILAPCNGTQIEFGTSSGGAVTVSSNTTGGGSGYVPNFNGGNGGVGSFPTGNTSNGTQQTSDSTSTNNNIITEPTLSLEEAALTSFVKNLTTEQREFLFPTVSIDSLQQNTENETWTSIAEYINENEYSEESQELVKNVIDLSIENDVELDFNVDEENLQIINSTDELNALIQAIKAEPSDDGEGETPIVSGDQIFATKTIDITSIHELVIEVVFNTSPFSLDSSGSTSYLGNIVIGNSWVQNSMSVTSTSYAPIPAYAQITLVGYILVGVDFEGLEFGVKQRKKIKFLIHKTTGEICCSTTENLN